MSQDWDVEPRRIEIAWQFLLRDPVIEGVLRSLALEAQNGSPSGLTHESACEFLAHHVIRKYSSLVDGSATHVRGGLTGRHLRMVLDYIQDNLAHSDHITCACGARGSEPAPFRARVPASRWRPAHAYVMGKRVAAARQLLLDEPTLTVEHIAMRLGFSSSSHLAAAFRRQTGYSPTVFRRIQSR